MKRLFIIRDRSGKVRIAYITCGGRFFGPTKKGRIELGDCKTWHALDSYAKEHKDELIKALAI